MQAHPSVPQAEAGYAREDAAGIPIDAPSRSFRDRFHKPELICALTDFHALCGFRDPVATLDVLATIDTAALDPIRDRLAVLSDVDGLGPLLDTSSPCRLPMRRPWSPRCRCMRGSGS